ncbi:unnamed protein product, partial [Discosporangium mesarthrocarpum]
MPSDEEAEGGKDGPGEGEGRQVSVPGTGVGVELAAGLRAAGEYEPGEEEREREREWERERLCQRGGATSPDRPGGSMICIAHDRAQAGEVTTLAPRTAAEGGSCGSAQGGFEGPMSGARVGPSTLPPELATPLPQEKTPSGLLETPSNSGGIGRGRWRPSFGGSAGAAYGDGGSDAVSIRGLRSGGAQLPETPAPWGGSSVLSTPAKGGLHSGRSMMGSASRVSEKGGLSYSSTWRRRGGSGGAIAQLLQQVRGRFDSVETRLLSGEFPFRQASAGAGPCRDHGDPRSRCHVALDLTVTRQGQAPPPSCDTSGALETVGAPEPGVSLGTGFPTGLSLFACFIHRVTEWGDGGTSTTVVGQREGQ